MTHRDNGRSLPSTHLRPCRRRLNHNPQHRASCCQWLTDLPQSLLRQVSPMAESGNGGSSSEHERVANLPTPSSWEPATFKQQNSPLSPLLVPATYRGHSGGCFQTPRLRRISRSPNSGCDHDEWVKPCASSSSPGSTPFDHLSLTKLRPREGSWSVRYLKFFHQYSYELLLRYAELPRG